MVGSTVASWVVCLAVLTVAWMVALMVAMWENLLVAQRVEQSEDKWAE